MRRVRAFLRARPWARRTLWAAGGAAVAPFLLFFVLNLVFPYPVAKLDLDPSPAVRDRRGEPLRRMLAPGQVWRIVVPLEEISPALVAATVAAEDRRFPDHCGVDPWAVLRAVWLDLRHWRIVSGASTLTMQLARLIEPRPRTFWGKAVEAFRALQIERILSKDEILGQYLNRAPYGGNLSGVEAAARAYFGRHAGELDLAQATLLAGLPQAPSRLRPDRHPDRARTRRDYVLDRLAAVHGSWSGEAVAQARATAVEVRRRPFEWVARHFTLRFEGVSLEEGGNDVRTTLDLRIQQLIEERLARHVERLRPSGIAGGAAVVLENATGAVRALVGSAAWTEPGLALLPDSDEQVDGTRARRSPGSTLKPFLYALALDAGTISPSEALYDVPAAWRDYRPENMDHGARGLITLEDALVSSLNLPAVRTLERVGTARFTGVLRELGFTTLTRPAEAYGLGLALGGCEVTLIDLTHAYTVLARGGTYIPLRWREDGPADLVDVAGELRGGPVASVGLGPRPAPVLSAEAAWAITRILQDRSRLGLAAGGDVPSAGARVAWKTGTSHGHRDAWCVGYDPRWTIGVWLGNPSGRGAADLVAVETAAPLLHDLFAAIGEPAAADWPARPPGVVERATCALTGQPRGAHCPATATGLALRFRSPDEPCAAHRPGGVVRFPDAIEAWLRENGMHPAPGTVAGASPREVSTAGADSGTGAGRPPRIVSPRDGERFVLLEGVPDATRLTLRASAHEDTGPLHWFVDTARVATAGPREAVVWALAPGAHRIVCVDARGRASAVSITVTR